MAEGVGFEPTRGISPPKRLAGARTRPLCDPSNGISCQYSRDSIPDATQLLYEYSTSGRNSENSCRPSASFPSPSRHSRLSSYTPAAVIPITITSFPPLILPPTVIPTTITSFPPLILPPHRHSHHHHVIPAKAGIQRPASDDALVEPHVVARLRARATILTCARWRDTTTLSSTCGRFSFSKRDLHGVRRTRSMS